MNARWCVCLGKGLHKKSSLRNYKNNENGNVCMKQLSYFKWKLSPEADTEFIMLVNFFAIVLVAVFLDCYIGLLEFVFTILNDI